MSSYADLIEPILSGVFGASGRPRQRQGRNYVQADAESEVADTTPAKVADLGLLDDADKDLWSVPEGDARILKRQAAMMEFTAMLADVAGDDPNVGYQRRQRAQGFRSELGQMGQDRMNLYIGKKKLEQEQEKARLKAIADQQAHDLDVRQEDRGWATLRAGLAQDDSAVGEVSAADVLDPGPEGVGTEAFRSLTLNREEAAKRKALAEGRAANTVQNEGEGDDIRRMRKQADAQVQGGIDANLRNIDAVREIDAAKGGERRTTGDKALDKSFATLHGNRARLEATFAKTPPYDSLTGSFMEPEEIPALVQRMTADDEQKTVKRAYEEHAIKIDRPGTDPTDWAERMIKILAMLPPEEVADKQARLAARAHKANADAAAEILDAWFMEHLSNLPPE